MEQKQQECVNQMKKAGLIMEMRPLVILTGPTAVGKTNLSIRLAQEIGGEIISADSMQVYRHMDIGSAKIRPEQMQGIRHYLIDILEPEEEFHVAEFQKRCKEAMEQIYAAGKIPILTGGTGFYIQSVLYDIDFSEEEKGGIRKRLEKAAGTPEGAAALYGRLKQVDPEAAAQIHPNNIKRLIRALEFYEETGKRISVHNAEERKKEAAYNACYFVLTDEREKLYQKIEQRIDQMLKEGLVDEVRSLKERGLSRKNVSMQGLGYKEILSYLEGEYSLKEAVYILKRDTRHFAKRQLTWFRRERDVIWIEKNRFAYSDEQILEYMKECMKQKGII